ncbi:hypothetical protein [Streptosporangium minutum]|uniref:hypothetical protein n=1 Tax=Streptosporangium minutum TaxID=569862 RepID=UPI0013FDBA85|nr:hypothetical protein [Streptosporangium minutum]
MSGYEHFQGVSWVYRGHVLTDAHRRVPAVTSSVRGDSRAAGENEGGHLADRVPAT